ncbi:MAG: DUF262 domain-containing protein [Planktothrix sp.]
MKLHAYTKSISELFSVKKKYAVPRFQREYSWTKEKVSELWDDIIANISLDSEGKFNHEEYFIGSLVLVGDDKSASMQIVDGQQRLTTLTILLSVLCHRFMEMGQENVAKSIYENYIAGKDDDGNYYFKLENNEKASHFFKGAIQHIEPKKLEAYSPEEKALLESYEELYSCTSRESLQEKLSRPLLEDDELYKNSLKVIREQVVNYLKVIFITVGEEDEAYTIFETLNARGMDLSFVDLIKNKLFKSFNIHHPNDDAKKKWEELQKTLLKDDVDLETFVRHWWIAHYNDARANEVYKQFKKAWNDGEINAEDILNDLVNDAKLYVKKISSPKEENFKHPAEKPIYRSLKALKMFEVKMNRPFLLSLFKSYYKGLVKLKNVKDTLFFMEKFHFCFNAICSMRPSNIEKIYSKAARDLLKAADKNEAEEILNKFVKSLIEKMPDKEIFKENFCKLKYLKNYRRNQRIIQYIFTYLELDKQKTGEVSPDNITLEHILPQSSGTEDFIGSIGNLLPLASQLNGKASNKSLQDKMEYYYQSKFLVTQHFTKTVPAQWGREEIEARTLELAEDCYQSMWGKQS